MAGALGDIYIAYTGRVSTRLLASMIADGPTLTSTQSEDVHTTNLQ